VLVNDSFGTRNPLLLAQSAAACHRERYWPLVLALLDAIIGMMGV
jgi:hypothetical protein